MKNIWALSRNFKKLIDYIMILYQNAFSIFDDGMVMYDRGTEVLQGNHVSYLQLLNISEK